MLSPPTVAHGFGQRFDLPVPLWLWVVGAGATILLSFLMMALFLKQDQDRFGYPRLNLLRFRVARAFAHPIVVLVLRAAAAVAFVVTVLAGFFGTPDPFRNLVPTMLWVVWWIGFAFVCALVGDLWALVNPLRTLFAWAETFYARLSNARSLSLQRNYPRRLGVWPSVILLFGFAWAELVWYESDVPLNLAVLIMVYSLFTWTGMFIYGREVWLQNADAFSVAFGVFARFAPLELRVLNGAATRRCPGPVCGRRVGDCVNGYVCLQAASPEWREWNLRPPAVGLLNDYPVRESMLVFIVLILSTVTFDGVLETPLFLDTLNWLMSAPGIAPTLQGLRAVGVNSQQVLMTLALFTVPGLFLAVFLSFCWLMVRVSRDSDRTRKSITTRMVACSFVLTLVPIAIAYHLAHYLSLLLTMGQFIIPLASDPFGAGWDLFGTSAFKVKLGVVSARFVWYAAVIAIVFGHVFSVFLAHVIALEVFGDARRALLSQIPMVALMVLYTMVSLWILAQPIVE